MNATPLLRVTAGPPSTVDADVLVVPVAEGGDVSALLQLPEHARADLHHARTSGEFKAKLWDTYFTSVTGWRSPRLAVIGSGALAEWTSERLRRVATAAALAGRQRGMARVAFVVPPDQADADRVQAVAEGLVLAAYNGDTFKTAPREQADLKEVVLVLPSDERFEAAARRGCILAACTNAARVLANEPGNVRPPRVLAERIAELVSGVNVSARVLEPPELEALGMGLVLGVGKGSAESPRLIELTYEPPEARSDRVLGLIGKGVTFDSGGISIKPAEGMDRMKTDMSGGAAVGAAMRAIGMLQPPVKVIGVIPAVENMPSGRALRPGDVLRGASGKTVEVNNTDAEGRLILADALWYAQRQGATHLVDVATLTGACVVALGRFVSGLLGTHDWWTDLVREVAGRAGDRVWQLPLDPEFGEQLKSDIADLVNTGGRAAGAVTAAYFLKEFAGDKPWAHLDIAGTAWADEARPYQPKGTTGVAVRTLAELPFTVGRWRDS